VLEVLKPFEVRAGDTTAVHEQVGAANDASLGENILSSESGGTVSTLKDSLALNLRGVDLMKGLLNGGGDQVVTLLFEELRRVLSDGLNSAGETDQGAVFLHVDVDCLDIETFGVPDSRVVLDNSSDLTTILLQEVGSPVADSTEALNAEGAALDALGEANLFDESLVAGHFTDSVVNTEAGGFGTASDTTLSNKLASAAALSIDVLLTLNVHVGVLDPGHDLFVGAHIRSKAINGSTDKALLDELHGVGAGNTLELTLGKLTRVDLDTTLAATEWDISDGKLEGHQGSKSLNLLKIDVFGVTGTTLAGELMGRVLSSVACNSLEGTVISAQGNVESYNSLA